MAELDKGTQELIDKLVDLRMALMPLAKCARVLEMPECDGYPFDDPDEVLWAGETGNLTVRDFRRALELLPEWKKDG